MPQFWRLLRTYLRSQTLRVWLLGVLLFGGIGLQLINPQIVRGFIDTAVQQGAPERLLFAALLFIGIAVVRQVMAVATTYVSENVAWTATNEMRNDLVEHCLRLDLGFHKARTPGELIERIDGDVSALSNFFSQFLIDILGNFLLLMGILVLLFREDWRVGLVMGVFVAVALVVLVYVRKIAVPYFHAVRETSAQFFGFLGEQLAGTIDLRSSGATPYVMQRFYRFMQDWWPVRRRSSFAGYSMWVSALTIFAVGNALAFALVAWLWKRNGLTIGSAYIIFYYTELMNEPIQKIRTQLQDLQKATASVERVQTLFGTATKLQDGIGTLLPDGPLAVAVDDITFGYDDDEPVLEDVSLDLRPGEVIGLLGRTGSGKTTLARLILRLYDPTHGEVRLGGVPVRDAKLADLRQHVAMVTQDVQLFHASVRDNLALFDPAFADERIVTVLHELGLGSWFASLPDGLDTILEGGLSAGEAQLLAFARVFLRDPGLVILDEASSRLDPATEQLIERAVDRLLKGRTAIIIAHRLPTVERADRIMILERGRVLETGPRRELARNPESRFAHLLRTGLEEVLA